MNIIDLPNDVLSEIFSHQPDFEFIQTISTCKILYKCQKLKTLTDWYNILLIKCNEYQYNFKKCIYDHSHIFYDAFPKSVTIVKMTLDTAWDKYGISKLPDWINNIEINYFMSFEEYGMYNPPPNQLYKWPSQLKKLTYDISHADSLFKIDTINLPDTLSKLTIRCHEFNDLINILSLVELDLCYCANFNQPLDHLINLKKLKLYTYPGYFEESKITFPPKLETLILSSLGCEDTKDEVEENEFIKKIPFPDFIKSIYVDGYKKKIVR